MIYLVDNIGTESGIHLYNSMFYENFRKSGKDNVILSNYKDEHTKRLVYNFYHGSHLRKGILVICSLIRIFFFSALHRKETFIYQSFGLRKIDQLFIQVIRCNNKNKYVLVHDLFDINDLDDADTNKKKGNFYKKNIKQIICHSKRTENDLRALGFEGRIVCFPHFRYNYDEQMRKYNQNNVGDDVRDSIASGKINLLFFGQVRESKGIDVVLGSLNYLEDVENLNFIVAGVDKQNLVTINNEKLLKKVLRYINNDEMMYLYSHCDYVLLPYKEIYQSGVMESMLYFKKPGIMSDVDFFAKIGKSYPSFGIVYSPNNAESLASLVRDICIGKYDNSSFYLADDVKRYDDAHDVTTVISKEF